MSKKVIVLCDSTVDLSPELIERFDIKVNPMPIIMDGRKYTDGVDVHPADLYEYTKTTGKLATTSAPNTDDYSKLFASYSDKNTEIVFFTISSGMSSAYNFARLAAEDFEGVYVVDSKNLSTGIALLALRASELAAEGRTGAEIVEIINGISSKVDTSFVIDTLDFLHKGGRCSTVAMLGANVLKLRPCIEVADAVMTVGKKYRGKMSDVLLSYIDERLKDVGDIDTSRVFVTHSYTDLEVPRMIYEHVVSLGIFDEVLFTTAGATISAHCGPNTLGILFIRKSDKA